MLFCGKYIVDSLVTYWEELDDLVWRTLSNEITVIPKA